MLFSLSLSFYAFEIAVIPTERTDFRLLLPLLFFPFLFPCENDELVSRNRRRASSKRAERRIRTNCELGGLVTSRSTRRSTCVALSCCVSSLLVRAKETAETREEMMFVDPRSIANRSPGLERPVSSGAARVFSPMRCPDAIECETLSCSPNYWSVRGIRESHDDACLSALATLPSVFSIIPFFCRLRETGVLFFPGRLTSGVPRVVSKYESYESLLRTRIDSTHVRGFRVPVIPLVTRRSLNCIFQNER